MPGVPLAAAFVRIRPDGAGFKSEADSIISGGLAGGAAIAGVTALIVGAGLASAKLGSDFQKTTTLLITGAGESEKNIESIREGLLQMAPAVGMGPTALAKAMFLVESAGFHGAAGLTVMKAAAEGAKIGGADATVVADGLTTALTDYNLPASAAATVTSKLVAAVAAGKTNMGDLSGALAHVLPFAASLKIGFNDVMGAMSTMTGQGIKAADSATYLKFTMMSMANETPKGKKALAAIGMTAQQLKDDLSTKGLGGTLQIVTDAIGKKFPAGSVGATKAMSDIVGGTRGMATALALTGSHTGTLIGNIKSIAAATVEADGGVKGWALTQKDFATVLDKAKAEVAAIAIKIGTGLLPVLTTMVGFVTATVLPGIQALFAAFSAGGSDITSAGFAGVMERIGLAAKKAVDFIRGTLLPAFQVFFSFLNGNDTGVDGPFREMAVAGSKLRAVIDALTGTLQSFARFLADNSTTIAAVAGVITAVFIPALVRMGVMATISGAETAAVWLMLQADAIAATAASVVAFVVQGVGWVATGVAAMAGAAVIAAAWLLSIWPIALIIAAVVGLGILIATHMDLIKGWISTAWNWIKNTTVSVWGSITSFFSTFWGAIVAGFTTAWGAVTGFVSTVWAAITGFVGKMAAMAVTILGWMTFPYRVGIAIVVGLVNILAQGVAAATNWVIGKVVAGWNSLWGFVAPIVNAIKNFIVGVWNTVSTYVGAIVTRMVGNIVAGFNVAKNFTVSVFNTVKSFLTGVWNTIYGAVSGFVGKIWAAISSAFDRVKATVSSIMNTVKAVISNEWNTIFSTVSGIAGRIWSVVSGAFGRITSAIGGAAGSAIAAASSLISKVVNAVKGGISGVYQIGSDIVSGLINGITGAAGRLWSAITSFIANNVPAPVRKLLGLASPSRLFAGYGRDTVEGFIVGVGDKKGKLAKTMAGLVQTPAVGSLDFASPGVRAAAVGDSGGLGGGHGDLLAEVQGLRGDIQALPKTYQMGQRQYA